MSMKRMFVLEGYDTPEEIHYHINKWWEESMLHNGVMVTGSIKYWLKDYPEDSSPYAVAKWIKETYTDIPEDEIIGIHLEW